jgi:AraC family transcriptional regulator, regulatory protein of adaptative response / DNA-3-methyladenine glycosylase II
VGLQRALERDGVRPSAKQLLTRAEAWRPWRAYAALQLWASLENAA